MEGRYRLRKKLASVYLRKLNMLFPYPKVPLRYSTPFQFLAAVILSAQSTDKQVNLTTQSLFKKYKTADDFARLSPSLLEGEIRSTGLYRAKARYIINTAKIIEEKYKGKIPCEMDKLVGLPGIGRKTANVVMSELCQKVEGIAVDTHVIRISKLLALTNNRDPKKIEMDLMEVIPYELWKTFSLQLIFYGRKYCPATRVDNSCAVGEINPNNPLKNCPLTVEMRNFFKSIPIAVVGVSHDPSKYGARIFKTLLHRGYKVEGINPKGGEVEGKELYPSLAKFVESKRCELAIFTIPPSVSKEVIKRLSKNDISLWFQPGSYDDQVLKLATEKGLETFYGECFMNLNGWW